MWPTSSAGSSRPGSSSNWRSTGMGACTADTAADESSANCTGSYTDGRHDVHRPRPGPSRPATRTTPGVVNALLADQADFNWITHTWSHVFLGCTVWQPQDLTSVTASGSGGTLTAGGYHYEITAATAYGESEPPRAQRSPSVPNGVRDPDLARGHQRHGHRRQRGTDPGAGGGQPHRRHRLLGLQDLPGEPGLTDLRPGRPGGREPVGDLVDHLLLHRHRRAPPARPPGLGSGLPDRHQPGNRLLERGGSWLPATQPAADSSIDAGDRPGPGVRRREQARPTTPRRRS